MRAKQPHFFQLCSSLPPYCHTFPVQHQAFSLSMRQVLPHTRLHDYARVYFAAAAYRDSRRAVSAALSSAAASMSPSPAVHIDTPGADKSPLVVEPDAQGVGEADAIAQWRVLEIEAPKEHA
jgi:hypothetical protein